MASARGSQAAAVPSVPSDRSHAPASVATPPGSEPMSTRDIVDEGEGPGRDVRKVETPRRRQLAGRRLGRTWTGHALEAARELDLDPLDGRAEQHVDPIPAGRPRAGLPAVRRGRPEQQVASRRVGPDRADVEPLPAPVGRRSPDPDVERRLLRGRRHAEGDDPLRPGADAGRVGPNHPDRRRDPPVDLTVRVRGDRSHTPGVALPHRGEHTLSGRELTLAGARRGRWRGRRTRRERERRSKRARRRRVGRHPVPGLDDRQREPNDDDHHADDERVEPSTPRSDRRGLEFEAPPWLVGHHPCIVARDPITCRGAGASRLDAAGVSRRAHPSR